MPRAWRSAGARSLLLALLLVYLPQGRGHRATGPRVSEPPPRRRGCPSPARPAAAGCPAPGPPPPRPVSAAGEAAALAGGEPRPPPPRGGHAAPPGPAPRGRRPAEGPPRSLKAGYRLNARSTGIGMTCWCLLQRKRRGGWGGGGWQAVVLYCSSCV